MSRFTYRKFGPGDEVEINILYQEITGRSRSLGEYLWQWHQSPSGAGDIWLIHDSSDNDRLIGHHGVMPIRFTEGPVDLLFGKIENTMVLSEFRSKILYPRYELRFKEQYQNRYHALFATMGPNSAIRVRKASGYQFPVKWQHYLLRTSLLAEIKYFGWLAAKGFNHIAKDIISISKSPSFDQFINAGFLSSEMALKDTFFDDFWREGRNNHGVAPRRDVADLKWKFWDNPYKTHYTFLFDSMKGCPGYAIVSKRPENLFSVMLDDFAVMMPSEKNYRLLLNALGHALNYAGIHTLRVNSTSDEVLRNINSLFDEREVFSKSLVKLIRRKSTHKMPRYITPLGQNLALKAYNWNITGLIFEGRN